MIFTLMSCETGLGCEISLPCTEIELDKFCAEVKMKNTIDAKVVIRKMERDADLFSLIGRKIVRLDELNFFIRTLEQLSEEEKNLFYIASGANSDENIQYLINMTFNLQCFSVISDFNYLHLIGRALYLNETGGADDDFNQTTFFKEKLQEGKFKVTPNGIVFYDKSQWQSMYDGKHFPFLPQKNTVLTLRVSKDGFTEYLNLPTDESAFTKVYERLNVINFMECAVELEGLSQFQEVETIVKRDFSFHNCNSIAKSLLPLSLEEKEQLNKLVHFIKIKNLSQLSTLISCLDHFSIIEQVKNAEEYGKYKVSEQNNIKFDKTLCHFIDFSGYGEEICYLEHGVFTEKGFLKYQGYNPEMGAILAETIGYIPRNCNNSSEIKLFFPLLIESFQCENEFGQLISGDGSNLKTMDFLESLLSPLKHSLAVFHEKMGENRGFMGQYSFRDSINAKVEKYTFDIEIQGNDLYGVALLQLNDLLSPEELQRIKQIIGGHAAGAVNEMLRKQLIDKDGREVCISLWNSSHWYLKTSNDCGFED